MSKTVRTFKYYDLIMAAFVAVLLCSNLIGATKVFEVTLFGKAIAMGGGILFFPAVYLFNDILTEVYGFKRARKVVWAGLISQVFAAGAAALVVALPPAAGFGNQAAVETIFGSTYRIVAASLTAYFFGEYFNSMVLAKMKLWTRGKHAWVRFIGSTVIGEGVDSLIFYPVAFLGVWSLELVVSVMVANYVLKVLWEVLAIPLTYRVCAFLKRAEHEDYFDQGTKFTPFSLET